LRISDQQITRIVHLAKVKQGGIIMPGQIEYSRVGLRISWLDRFWDPSVRRADDSQRNVVKNSLVDCCFHKVVLPVTFTFVDVPIKRQIETRMVSEATYNWHAEAHHLHLVLLVIADGRVRKPWYRYRAEFVGIRRARVTKNREHYEFLSPFFKASGLLHVWTHEDP